MTSEVREWTERYRRYASVHGQNDPSVQLSLDEETWPGGRMCGYILWVSQHWRAFCASIGVRSSEQLRLAIGDAADARFDEWLAANAQPLADSRGVEGGR